MSLPNICSYLASVLMAFALVTGAAAQKRTAARDSAEAARQRLDSLTAEVTQSNLADARVASDASANWGTGTLDPAYPNPSRKEKAKAALKLAAGWLGIRPIMQNMRYPQNTENPGSVGMWPSSTNEAGQYPFASPRVSGQAFGGARMQAASNGPASPAGFRRIQSPSGTVTLSVPADWQPMPPLGSNFSAVSPRGESFSCGEMDIYWDQASMRNTLEAAHMMGANRLQIAYMQRMVSPQLRPAEIVAQLFPQISGGAMQNVRILGTRPLPDGASSVHYQYLLLPQRDLLYASTLPPRLRHYSQVPMKGEAHIQLVSGVAVGVSRTWGFLYAVISAPTEVYAANPDTYSAIFQSVQADPRAVQQSMAQQQSLANSIGANMKQQNQTIQDWSRRTTDAQNKQLGEWTERNRKMGDIWTDMAGAQQRYIDPSHPDWASRTSVDNIPMGAQYQPYRCPAEDVTDSQIFWGDGTAKPYVDCLPLQKY